MPTPRAGACSTSCSSEDGQTLSALEQRLPMTRFGVMKHLKVLEEAGLVVTRRRGREKLHFLNPVPIRLVHDRWVSKYAEPWAAALSGLKNELEDRTMEKVFEIYIKTTPERLWQAITDSEMRRKYNFGVGVSLRLDDRLPLRRRRARRGGADRCEGENLEVDPPRRLVQSFNALLGRRRQGRGDLAGHLGDRAGRRFLPADRDPRSAARGRQRRALRRLADDPLGPEDAARDGRDADDARLADVFGGLGIGRLRALCAPITPLLAGALAIALAGCGAGGAASSHSSTSSGLQTAAEPFTPHQLLIEKGARLVVADGCAACHLAKLKPGVAPSFITFAGHEVALADGRRVLVDERFISEALRNPEESPISGYDPAPMIAAVRRLQLGRQPQQVAALAAFIEQIGPEPEPG